MTNEETIWRFLWERLGNAHGVAGLMGNLQAESALRPDNLQNSYERSLGMSDAEYVAAVNSGKYSEESFATDRAGFGLGQFTHPDRKRALYRYACEFGQGIADLYMQLNFILKELSQQYRSVLNVLLTARTVREASDAVMDHYEIPADMSEANHARRAALGEALYARFVGEDKSSAGNVSPPAPTETAKAGVVMNDRAEQAVEIAKSLIGCDYVFGARGEIRNGRPVFDCRGYTWYVLNKVGISISPVGATTQWKTAGDWVERGQTADSMPNVVCCVFKRNGDKMAHTGLHIGDGAILHCTENGGVKYGSLEDRTWTHYAIPRGLYSRDEIDSARGMIKMRTLRNGSAGMDVQELQERLNALGYSCGVPDGLFGGKTAAAVKAFQGDHRLLVDGVVGPSTWAALDDAEAEKSKDESKPDSSPEKTPEICIPKAKVEAAFVLLADVLGYTIDARSGNVSPIDFQ